MATAVTASRSPFSVVQGSGSRPQHHSLSSWMNRVLEELAKFRSTADDDTVHDLRVVIRRCRSLAAVMEEIDPDPAWPQMRKAARKLFRGLGAVRDAQVLENWVKQLGPEGDPLRPQLLAALKAGEAERAASSVRVAVKFDTKSWIAFAPLLRRRIRLVPVGGAAAQCLALERLEEARDRHAHALRTNHAKPWHGLRIALKKLRYTVECLLPEHYAAWRKNLKRLQDLLGDIHDLDVLADKLAELHVAAEAADPWRLRIEQERHQRVETYRQLTLGTTSLWHEWRLALPSGERLDSAIAARLGVTARAADKHVRRSAQESRIALRLFDILLRQSAAPLFKAASTRKIMRASAQLHGVSVLADRRGSPKAIRKFLRNLALPPTWSSEDWDLLTWSVRFQRGPEPEQKNGFAKLSEAQQSVIRAIAGILRLARALRKAGIQSPVGFRSERSLDALVIRVPALPDTAEAAGRFAKAKHLLESVLPKPLILRSVPVRTKSQPASSAAVLATAAPPLAAASD
jgi:CHAD domain-containing protein